jgi:hypothetical protein
MARTKQTARKQISGKNPRKSHASKQVAKPVQKNVDIEENPKLKKIAKSVTDIDKLTGSEVLARLRTFSQYKNMSDYAIKKLIGDNKLATVGDLKDELSRLMVEKESKSEEKESKSEEKESKSKEKKSKEPSSKKMTNEQSQKKSKKENSSKEKKTHIYNLLVWTRKDHGNPTPSVILSAKSFDRLVDAFENYIRKNDTKATQYNEKDTYLGERYGYESAAEFEKYLKTDILTKKMLTDEQAPELDSAYIIHYMKSDLWQ